MGEVGYIAAILLLLCVIYYQHHYIRILQARIKWRDLQQPYRSAQPKGAAE